MKNWASICQIMRHADKESEMAYQKYIKDMVLEIGLGWHDTQISEQPSLQLGSLERLVPDILVSKDSTNRFVIEVKKPGHIKKSENINQLVSYMKQLETSVGIYWGDEVEVYYKKLGDGSLPILLMSLHFDSSDSNGDDFVSLFSENCFLIESILSFKQKKEEKIAFESDVKRLLKHITTPDFHEELLGMLKENLMKKGESENIIDEVLNQIELCLSTKTAKRYCSENTKNETGHPCITEKECARRNKGTAQRYAYNLIKQIIEKNPTFSFEQLYTIFNRKNRIEDIRRVKDETRWFMNEEDVITIADGTKIVVSNQWGFNNNSKPKMDNLRSIAKKYSIDISGSHEKTCGLCVDFCQSE